ncbi:MAG TPA: Hpt domain-containing protein [Candidatus Acidoferrum sp.]|nr:Hpt domain-containing protein [Candidatus Acidoferrum sp.]
MAKTGFDFEELLSRVENDRELMRDLLLIFKEEFPLHHQALREAVEHKDVVRIESEAHKLKGMLSNLAAHEAAEAAARLELLVRSAETSEFQEPFAEFDRIAEELARELDSCLAEVSR